MSKDVFQYDFIYQERWLEEEDTRSILDKDKRA